MRLRPTVTIGQLFADRYQVEQLLGRGGMGSVYRVHDRELDEHVALKLLEAASPELITRFRREVRLARRVTHRNAARTFDLGEHGGLRFLTMELVDGESLRERHRRAPPTSLTEIVDIARQIAEGLAAAHAAGVVHRDLKPANVLLERGGRVVITDFGIARTLHVAGDASLQTHGALGTPAYMAPEQLAGERVGPATDSYSLGLMLHELLTGTLPFAAATPMQTALARLHEPPPALETSHGVDSRLAALVAGLLARMPKDRPSASMAALALGSLAPTVNLVTSSQAIDKPTLALAVLPFTYRGPEADRYLADALADELVDLLAATEGLRLIGVGVTAKFSERRGRDPRSIGRELGVDAIVDGTAQIADGRLRVIARLIDSETGFQRWTERFDGTIGDVFELQDRLAKRIAEALRVEVEQSIHRGDASPEAIEHYLRARQLARLWRFKGEDGAVARLRRCLELAPGFRPALASYAHACVRAWFIPRKREDPDWEPLAEQAIAAALAGAPEIAETQLAAARWASYAGNHIDAARHLRQAVAIAPTYAEAHHYLGLLQLEGGRPRDGLARVELALELDPTLLLAHPSIARYHALRGDLAEYERWIARFFATKPRPSDTPVRVLQARVAGWYGDRERAGVAADELARTLGPTAQLPKVIALFAATKVSAATLLAPHAAFAPSVPNPFFRATTLQIACELALIHGHESLATDRLEELAVAPFSDLDWLERCVVLEPVHEHDAYRRCLAATRARVDAVGWR